jgi:uncharacterized membrane protein (DUF485 family)
MDTFTFLFYAIVCGVLAYASPVMKNKIARLAIGFCMGLLAAAILPLIRTAIYS